MENKNEYVMVITTCGEKETAKSISKLLVKKRLAACVQMLPIESVYLWEGDLCDENEIALFIKAKTMMFDQIAETIRKNHNYEIPEIIQIPITDGLPEYLKWIDECTLAT